MLDVDRRDHVDPGIEQLVDVLPALLVARARHVGVGELVDQRDGGVAGQHAVEVHLLEARATVLDHRRILATALGRLRGKLKYRPVVFELLPPEFTLYDLQQTVEAISGTLLHKQNFRRLVEKGRLVEGTGNVSTETGGRPARLYRFRREVVLERPAPGLRVKAGRG